MFFWPLPFLASIPSTLECTGFGPTLFYRLASLLNVLVQGSMSTLTTSAHSETELPPDQSKVGIQSDVPDTDVIDLHETGGEQPMQEWTRVWLIHLTVLFQSICDCWLLYQILCKCFECLWWRQFFLVVRVLPTRKFVIYRCSATMQFCTFLSPRIENCIHSVDIECNLWCYSRRRSHCSRVRIIYLVFASKFKAPLIP